MKNAKASIITLHYSNYIMYIALTGPMRVEFSRYIGPGAGKSLTGPVALAIDVLFRFFFKYFFFFIFNTL